ncbi:MAG: transporter substrate-binding domain-containing protein [Pseudomonadota bacterium]
MNQTTRLGILLSAILTAPLAHAADVRMGFGLSLIPYVIQESNSGFELEIFREALAFKGHVLKPVYVAQKAMPQMLKEKKLDAAQRGSPDLAEDAGVYYASQPAVVYEDYAVSLKKNKLAINTMADLKGKSIAAFMTAKQFLGPEYAAAVQDNPKYQEVATSKRQVLMLYSGGIDVLICDANIFKYTRDAEKGQVDISPEVTYHKIFNHTPLKSNNPVFADKQVRDDFDAGLAELKRSGKYQKIIAKYVKD